MHEMHGMRHSSEYTVWLGMKNRCLNPREPGFVHYGGRGITICQDWIDSFMAFYQDMGKRPPRRSLDRIDNDGPYCKENCRWATNRTQANNTRANHLITANGITHTMAEWMDIVHLSRSVITDRLNRGWTPEDTLFTPVRHCSTALITFDGRAQSLSAWAREIDISIALLHQRLQDWTVEEALTTPVGGRRNNITFNGKTQTLSAWSREIGVRRATIRRRIAKGLPMTEVLKPRK